MESSATRYIRLFASSGVIAADVREGDSDAELRAQAPATSNARRYLVRREVIDWCLPRQNVEAGFPVCLTGKAVSHKVRRHD
jgi:hypothetical protein